MRNHLFNFHNQMFLLFSFHSTTAFPEPSCRLRIEQLSEIETGWMGCYTSMIGGIWHGAVLLRKGDQYGDGDGTATQRLEFCFVVYYTQINYI